PMFGMGYQGGSMAGAVGDGADDACRPLWRTVFSHGGDAGVPGQLPEGVPGTQTPGQVFALTFAGAGNGGDLAAGEIVGVQASRVEAGSDQIGTGQGLG